MEKVYMRNYEVVFPKGCYNVKKLECTLQAEIEKALAGNDIDKCWWQVDTISGQDIFTDILEIFSYNTEKVIEELFKRYYSNLRNLVTQYIDNYVYD